MRLHYFCDDCAETIVHGPPLTKPMPSEPKNCCFCTTASATMRANTERRAECPRGHLPPGKLESIFRRAWKAARKGAAAK